MHRSKSCSTVKSGLSMVIFFQYLYKVFHQEEDQESKGYIVPKWCSNVICLYKAL